MKSTIKFIENHPIAYGVMTNIISLLVTVGLICGLHVWAGMSWMAAVATIVAINVTLTVAAIATVVIACHNNK